MSVVLSLIGHTVRIEQSDDQKPTLNLSLLSCGINFDDAAQGIEFFEYPHRVYVGFAEITSPTLANYAALKTLLLNWQTNALKIGGKMGEPVELTITRPANTTAYAANDVISSSESAPTAQIIDLATAGVEAGGSGYLVKLRALTNNKNWTGRLRLHLYRSAITPPNDNSPFALLWANRSNRIGSIDITGFNTADNATSDAANALIADLRFPFRLAPTETRLWCIIQNLDGPTPASAQQFFFSVLVDRN